MYYKLGQACVTNWGRVVLLHITANVVTNWGSFIFKNQGKYYYKLGKLLQIRETVITKQGRYYKLGQNVLQIGESITNQGIYYKLGHNNEQILTHGKDQLVDTFLYGNPNCNLTVNRLILNAAIEYLISTERF